MNRKEFLLSLGALVTVPRFVFGQEAKTNAPPGDLVEAFEAICKKYDFPALAGAVVRTAGTSDLTTVGVRKKGADERTTKDDLWHLGSNSKMMTATVAARLVEAGKLKWNSTLGDVFPKITYEKAPEAKAITLVHLLSHRSGLPGNPERMRRFYESTDPLPKQRVQILTEAVGKPLSAAPGDKFQYSNLGYILAGAMIEAVTGKSWEEVIQEQLFNPLQMASVGFGPTGSPSRKNQPWPHGGDGKPVETGVFDNAPVLGPAGTVHCSLADWGKFIGDQLRGARGEKGLLKPESYKMLQTAQAGSEYGLGWGCFDRPWADGLALNHSGSNTFNFAIVWMAPKRDIAALVCTNSGQAAAPRGVDEAVLALLKKYIS